MKLPILSTHEMKYFWHFYQKKSKCSFFPFRRTKEKQTALKRTFFLSFLEDFAMFSAFSGNDMGVNAECTRKVVEMSFQ